MKANDLRKGAVILFNGAPHKVMEFFHNTPGKGRASVQAKLRNLLTGLQTENKFASTESVEEAEVYSSKATFMYQDGTDFHFMDSTTYEQNAISTEILGDAVYYLQENMEVDVTTFEGSPIDVKLPTTVVLTVEETAPELKGATATNSPKPATTDTGLSLSVPPFIKQGERIVVSTADGKYMKRAD